MPKHTPMTLVDVVTPLKRWEARYPGCSWEPPWWPSSKPVVYREVERMSPVTLRGPNVPLLIATRGKDTLAYWSVVLCSWVVVLP